MHISIRQMQILQALAEHGSLTGAAEACHITQPSVSMQLKSLSEQLDMPLYEIIGKQAYLTQAGNYTLAAAQAIQQELEYLRQQLAALRGLTAGSLKIAMVSTAQYFLPRMLGRFCQTYPDLEISFQVANRDGVVQRLRQNQDDLYIMTTPPDSMDLQILQFLDNPLYLIAAHDHPLSQYKRLQRQHLQQHPFILREPGSGTRMACSRWFDEQGIEPKVRLELGSNEAIISAVAAGLGLSIVSRHALPKQPQREGIRILNFHDLPIPSQWYIVYPQGKKLSPIAQVFCQHLLSLRQEKS